MGKAALRLQGGKKSPAGISYPTLNACRTADRRYKMSHNIEEPQVWKREGIGYWALSFLSVTEFEFAAPQYTFGG